MVTGPRVVRVLALASAALLPFALVGPAGAAAMGVSSVVVPHIVVTSTWDGDSPDAPYAMVQGRVVPPPQVGSLVDLWVSSTTSTGNGKVSTYRSVAASGITAADGSFLIEHADEGELQLRGAVGVPSVTLPRLDHRWSDSGLWPVAAPHGLIAFWRSYPGVGDFFSPCPAYYSADSSATSFDVTWSSPDGTVQATDHGQYDPRQVSTKVLTGANCQLHGKENFVQVTPDTQVGVWSERFVLHGHGGGVLRSFDVPFAVRPAAGARNPEVVSLSAPHGVVLSNEPPDVGAGAFGGVLVRTDNPDSWGFDAAQLNGAFGGRLASQGLGVSASPVEYTTAPGVTVSEVSVYVATSVDPVKPGSRLHLSLWWAFQAGAFDGCGCAYRNAGVRRSLSATVRVGDEMSVTRSRAGARLWLHSSDSLFPGHQLLSVVRLRDAKVLRRVRTDGHGRVLFRGSMAGDRVVFAGSRTVVPAALTFYS